MILLCALAGMALMGPSLEAQVASVLPTAAEGRWLQIPWKTNMMQARVEAQRQGKPMFLWIMNGSPLGCT